VLGQYRCSITSDDDASEDERTRVLGLMIGFFTDPYPDELLYSACARYHRRARNISKEATARDLFGNARVKIVVDLQPRLGYLAAQLPPETYSVSRLIDEHTMLPFYTPFLPAGRQEALRQDMYGDGGGSVHARLGILLPSRTGTERLRFCPACAREDREPYWHRVHQAPGVHVCPTHAVFLSDSEVSVRNRSSGRALVTARQAIGELPTSAMTERPLDPENRDHQALLFLARDAAWLLNARIEILDQNVLRRRYLRLLLERGLATYGGVVRHRWLNDQFLEHYSPPLLEKLGCKPDSRCQWLRPLINDWGRARHPLHHLLLMQFLGCPAEKFFGLPAEIEPYGNGPWPCLNPAGGHYRELRVAECLISHTHDESKQLLGTFRCECGFSYRRVGPDTTDQRRYEYDRITSYGDAWYEKLREMQTAGNRSRGEMALALGVSPNVVKAKIKRLKSSDESGVSPTQLRKIGRPRLDFSELGYRDKHRERWLDVVAKNPEASRTEHRRTAAEAYNWLVKHDKEWLEENSPERRGRIGERRSPVNWKERDKEYSSAARNTATAMLTTPGRPVRASRTAIAKNLGILAVVFKTPAKLPLTIETLDEVSESITAFAVRRIRWAADCYCEEQVPAVRWKLQIRAAVSNNLARDSKVKVVLEECAQALRVMSESGWEGLVEGPR
jgi:hypothetical protein